ncbi:MAG: FMN-binding negative transcriptional regulator, partial [Casimicrobium sp.]
MANSISLALSYTSGMYIPKHFESPDRGFSIEIMRTHSFATLITTQQNGDPLASHIPLVVDDD